jgi:DNA-binding transcriptional LysR family regulator
MPSAEAICKHFQQGLSKLGVDWFPSIEVSSIDLIEAYVANGFGIGLSVQVPDAKLSANVRVVPLPDFTPVIMGALWRGRPSALLQSFLDELLRRGKDLATPQKATPARAPRPAQNGRSTQRPQL